ncbi:hypothetical protein HOT95_gp143 [Vibrio phage vB_VpS_PG07]|nr:hypothetical protein HOT95_gp143 [Vibrio phage vB_VpS_PG07]AXQ66768.1 hypothetical protein [Vibrio phage vB_VpS_PG07]
MSKFQILLAIVFRELLNSRACWSMIFLIVGVILCFVVGI